MKVRYRLLTLIITVFMLVSMNTALAVDDYDLHTQTSPRYWQHYSTICGQKKGSLPAARFYPSPTLAVDRKKRSTDTVPHMQ